MILVRHFKRGFGHAWQLPTGNWEVYFFDEYQFPVQFHNTVREQVLTFFPEGG
jgi:hypothetical protein